MRRGLECRVAALISASDREEEQRCKGLVDGLSVHIDVPSATAATPTHGVVAMVHTASDVLVWSAQWLDHVGLQELRQGVHCGDVEGVHHSALGGTISARWWSPIPRSGHPKSKTQYVGTAAHC